MWCRSRRFVAVAAGSIAAASGLVALAVAPVAAQAAPQPPTAPAEGAGLLPGLDARLVGVPLAYGQSSRDVTALQAAEARVKQLVEEHGTLVAKRTELDQRLGFLDQVQQGAARELEAAVTDLQNLTAQVYTNGGTGAWQAAALLDTQNVMDLNRVNALGEGYAGELQAAKRRAKIARERATALATKFALERADVSTRLDQVERVELPAAQRELELARVQAASTLAGASVGGLGIPLASLDAYLRAQNVLARDLPQCGVEWWMIAGIGRVESNHGRYGGAQPGQNGNVAPRIIGIPLDGSPGVAAIRDTDLGLWDGDNVWDRAVGPMQFIPSTWKGYAADNNGDGATDPNNVYDAALGTGRYLCRAAGHLGDDGSLTRAYLAYNASQSYAADVLAGARRYQHTGIPAAL